MSAPSVFLQALEVAKVTGRGELLRAAPLPTDPADIRALVEDLALHIEGAAFNHRRRELLKGMAGEVLGAIRSGTAMQLARLLVATDPTVAEVHGSDVFKERAQAMQRHLLDLYWPMAEEAHAREEAVGARSGG